ncbi:MAG TPA: 4,5-DOPA dioxygenase extradiol [Candidatus Cloacimonadota bacterium]|nr:4,5-DOPA dioxygenase extradiol [Candidatus Cloacimonadota bacterium]
MSRMPLIFVGHGSPMNAIEDNTFTQEWSRLGKSLPKPKAILCVSAHWYSPRCRINSSPHPRQIYDMYGFPEALYRVKYPAKGSPELAQRVQKLLGDRVEIDNSWGIDHGAWSVLVHLFPEADIPIVQLSLASDIPGSEHLALGRLLQPLRESGVPILASGNIVHNLGRVDWKLEGGFNWAKRFDDAVHALILDRKHQALAAYEDLCADARLSIPTPEHYLPLLYALGASAEAEVPTVFNRSCVLGSLSMTGYIWGNTNPKPAGANHTR